jgi:hypothetical protein
MGSHHVVVEQVGVPGLNPGQASLMRQHLGDRRLAGAELRPVAAERIVERQLPPLDQQQDARRREPLGPGEHQLDRVPIPRPSGVPIRRPTPQVDDQFTVLVRREGRAELTSFGEVPRERLGHTLESRCRKSIGHDTR